MSDHKTSQTASTRELNNQLKELLVERQKAEMRVVELESQVERLTNEKKGSN